MPMRTKARRNTVRHNAPGPSRRISRPAHPAPVRRTIRHAKPAKPVPVAEVRPNGINGFTKALRFLSSLLDFERLRIVRYNTQNFDLDRMRLLLKRLGNPQDSFKSVHVAGTKGKGSTCAMIASMLEASGYNGQMISHAEFARLVKEVEPIVMRMKPMPSYFEVMTAVAFKHFAEEKIGIAVVETGLGGRLDATNVIKPEVTAITSISKDHMAQLGPTISRIAEEKAGIFKAGIPAISVVQDPEAEVVLKRVADKVGAPLDVTGKTIEFSYRFESSRMLGPHNRVCLTTPNSRFEHLAVPLFGEHQAINCGLALSVIDRLKVRGFTINDARAMEGLAKTTVPGRMEMVSQVPRVIVDGAHNAASIDALMRAIGQHIPYDSMVVIFGCCADKDVSGMLERIAAGADKVIFTKVDNIRSSDPAELSARYIEQYGKMAQVAHTLEDAMAIANRAVTKEDLICITGSFYLVGAAKKHFATPKLT
jgi:dihydrofolate synthase / folylpolyglutamate synthase